MHPDKQPSFKIYKNNTWYCFSECVGGDSIKLIQKLQNVGFIEAVKFLIK
jgi:DNA primase